MEQCSAKECWELGRVFPREEHQSLQCQMVGPTSLHTIAWHKLSRLYWRIYMYRHICVWWHLMKRETVNSGESKERYMGGSGGRRGKGGKRCNYLIISKRKKSIFFKRKETGWVRWFSGQRCWLPSLKIWVLCQGPHGRRRVPTFESCLHSTRVHTR